MIPLSGSNPNQSIFVPSNDAQWTIPSSHSSRLSFDVFNESNEEKALIFVQTSHSSLQLQNTRHFVEHSIPTKIFVDCKPPFPSDLFIQLEHKTSGQVYKIKLNLSNELKAVEISFSTIHVGTRVQKEVSISGFVDRTMIPAPFSCELLEGKRYYFYFSPTSPGEFKKKIEMDDFVLLLSGTALPSLFYFDTKMLTVTNVSKDTLKFDLSVDDEGLRIKPSSMTLAPGDLFHVQVFPNFPRECHVGIRVENSSGVFEYRYRILKKQIENALISPSILGFFRLKEPQSTSVKITGSDNVNFLGPDWIDVEPPLYNSDQFRVTCRYIPKALSCSSLVFNEGRSHLPILAYNGSASIYCGTDNISMEYRNGGFRGSIKLLNTGTIAGFAVFVAQDQSQKNLFISPRGAVIESGKEAVFQFQLCGASDVIELSLNLVWGDEILRQVESFLNPLSFYSLTFNAVESKDQISSFSNLMKHVRRKDFRDIFAKTIQIKTVRLEGDKNKKYLGYSHDTLRCKGDKPELVTVFNSTSTESRFEVRSNNNDLVVDPTSGVVPPFTSCLLSIMHTGMSPGTLTISTTNQEVNIIVLPGNRM